MNRFRYVMFAATLFLVLALSAMNTVPAFADDGAPPPAEPAGEVVPPVDEVVTETPPVEEVVPPVEEVVAETPPVEEVVPPVEEVVTETPPTEEPATLPELLEQLPEGTDVVVTNEDGEVVPLASEEAAEIFAGGDPIWCPAGVAPSPGIGGCSPSYNAFGNSANTADLWGWLDANDPAKAGVIWVASSYDGWSYEPMTGAINLDGSYFNNLDNYALTIQGGWNGVYGSKTVDISSPSLLENQLFITNWTGAITLNNITVTTNSVDIASDQYALDVQTKGTITLNNVSVEGNADAFVSNVMGGANLNNTSGVGNVVINNSSFNDNQGDGLVVNTKGTVTTNNLSANGNGRHGVYIDNDWGSVAKTVTMKGFKQFNGNGGSGLVIHSYGAIKAANLVALGNGWGTNPSRGFIDDYSWGDGVYLNNTWGWYLNTYQPVSITGNNLFDANYGSGLVINSFGAIAVSNITATWNGSSGAALDNCGFSFAYMGTGDCGSKAAKPITVSGTNVFNHNGWDGLNINSSGGVIKVSNITASYNFSGAYIDNRWSNYYNKKTAGTWTIIGYGIFNGNDWGGLTGWSYGPMILSNITANDNGYSGADLHVTNTFTLKGYGVFNNNDGQGLLLSASSNATLTNITANDNTYEGVYVTAWRAGTYVANVFFKGINTFNDNGYYTDGVDWWYYDGLHVETDGKIALSNVTATYNGSDGAYLCNQTDAAGVFLCGTDVSYTSGGVTYTVAKSIQGITLTGLNNFSFNSGYGLFMISNGALTARNITANDNTYGAYLTNDSNSLAPYNVTLTGVNTFNYNYYDGLQVYSYGAIAVSNLTANNNGTSGTNGRGAVLDNSGGSIIKTVKISGYARVNTNYYTGLQVYSLGAITISNITATDSITGAGAYLDNQMNYTKQSNVTITGVNLFSDNVWGLTVYSYGTITASNITSNWNDSYGASLVNWGGLYAKNITLTGTNSFNWNGDDGLYFYANGAVTLFRITANYNGDAAGDSGIEGYTNGKGNITLTCGFAYGNFYDGIYLNAAGGKLVTVKGWYAYGNGNYDYYFTGPNLTSRICLLP